MTRFYFTPSTAQSIDNWTIQSLFWGKESRAWRFLVIASSTQLDRHEVEVIEFLGT